MRSCVPRPVQAVRHVSRHSDEVRAKGDEVIRSFRPEIIISFGPDGISGHVDHIAVEARAQQLAAQCHLPFAAATLPLRLQQSAAEWLTRRRQAPHYIDRLAF